MEVRFNEHEIKRFMNGRDFIRDFNYPKIDEGYLAAFSDCTPYVQRWVARKMKYLRDHAQWYERLFAGFLAMHHVKFIPQAPFRAKRRVRGGEPKVYFADFYLPAVGAILEIDGKSHEGYEVYDKIREQDFLELGIKTIHVSYKAIRHRSYFDFDFIFE